MANSKSKKLEAAQAAPVEKKKYDKGRWAYPHTRAKGYAQ